ncbi:MAG: DUF2934 domain-containing protein [Candidatus Acidiferrum sp.]
MQKTRETSSLKSKKARTTKKGPTQEEIALRAYHLYLERGGAPGNPLEDWTRAERELVEEPKKARRKATVTSIAA